MQANNALGDGDAHGIDSDLLQILQNLSLGTDPVGPPLVRCF